MKRAVYYVIPVVLIIVAARFFRSAPTADGPCNLSAAEYKEADKTNDELI